MGTNAINPKYGITDNDLEVVQLKKAMLGVSKKKVLLTISEKLNTVQPIKVCDLSDVDYLITELDPRHEILRPFVEVGIQVL
ncbi:MAG: hypothetical protein QM727_12745 [Niabella sp.]